MHQLLYLVFFLSGAAALVFEALWFRQAGLAFGNSVWSVSLVLSSFMGGLALGNILMVRYGRRLTRPIRTYLILETLIAGSGLAIVLLLPSMGAGLSPFFRLFLDSPALLNLIRLALAFVVLMIPATAMGATLPVLVTALSRRDENFGRVLGKLYGWNTLGATAGALAAELYLTSWFGVHGAGMAAALISLVAVALAAVLRKGMDEWRPDQRDGEGQATTASNVSLTFRGRRILFGAALAGATMLGLEVLWFRFLLLFRSGTSLTFAMMLATVLCGIAAGGILTGWLYSRRLLVHRHLRAVACSSGVLIAAAYWAFEWLHTEMMNPGGSASLIGFVLCAVILMFPVSAVSGVLFIALGRALKEEIPNETRAAAWLTLSNTAGAMFGSLIAGFVLLPTLGIEKSLFVTILLYALMALTIPSTKPRLTRREMGWSAPVLVLFVCSVVLFPFGLMNEVFIGSSLIRRFPNMKVVASREGLTETIVYLEHEKLGQPYFHRMMTNSYTMSATNGLALRYMKLFVYLPVALRANPESALLISYGVGNTAKALTDTKSLKSIDIVDISKDILEMNDVVYPDPKTRPLNDERVDFHIEDGRFFLQVTPKRFDLITAEPPPPRVAGVVNLYTQEYFELIRDRLNPGGITSYWLPVHSVEDPDARAIIKAFCNVFEDCSMWAGAGLDWVLLGTRDGLPPVSEEAFSRQWRDPSVADELRAIGVESPEQLGSLYMADAADLAIVTDGVLPVVDDYPHRILTPRQLNKKFPPLYIHLMDATRAARSFAKSPFINRHWPAELVSRTQPFFHFQRLINQKYSPGSDNLQYYFWENLRRLLTDTELQSLPLWLMGSNYYEQRLVDGSVGVRRYEQLNEWSLARRDIAERRYSDALGRVVRLRSVTPYDQRALLDKYYLLVLCLTGDWDQAAKFITTRDERGMSPGSDPKGTQLYVRWIEFRFPQVAQQPAQRN